MCAVFGGETGMRLPNTSLASAMTCALLAHSAMASDRILYCTEQHIAGMQQNEGKWGPTYGGQDFGRRYTIRFNEDLSEMSGVHGGTTVYQCHRYFPNKSPDVVSCVNPLVRTMIFNYSTENRKFHFSMISPGGWLGLGTERAKGQDPLSDVIIMGECQEF
jgi:hypothetical protein